eukprot:COSAG04_NODE_19615_length_412_cov_0.661342_2_plen_77_part_01
MARQDGGVVIQDTEEPPGLLAYFPASAIVEATESTCEGPLDQSNRLCQAFLLSSRCCAGNQGQTKTCEVTMELVSDG